MIHKIISAFRGSDFAGFIMVGTVGFLVDGGILTLLAGPFAVNIYLSRVCSFIFATLVTWQLNSQFVFNNGNRSKVGKREYGMYLSVQSGGALINLGVFTLVILSNPKLESIPIVPLFFGSLTGLLFNFIGSKYWVFKFNRIQVKK